MAFEELSTEMLPAVEDELHEIVDLYKSLSHYKDNQKLNLPDPYEMLTYHLGWSGNHADNPAKGKRIRPLLVLLTCDACGGEWKQALPAAGAVELIHNFSLIHDDIQDESPIRHGRPTIWKRWGLAQGINAGDLMFTLALASLIRPDHSLPHALTIKAENTLIGACVNLTRGQALDLAFEACETITVDEYMQMVYGKTSAMMIASTVLGGLVAEADDQTLYWLSIFGEKLGYAFQAQDDFLGIWGELAQTGKSVESDLASRKKTLPVVFALQKNGTFARYWKDGSKDAIDTARLVFALENEGARDYTLQTCEKLTTEAMDALGRAITDTKHRKALVELATRLLNRNR